MRDKPQDDSHIIPVPGTAGGMCEKGEFLRVELLRQHEPFIGACEGQLARDCYAVLDYRTCFPLTRVIGSGNCVMF